MNSRFIALSITFLGSLFVVQAQSPAKLNINLKQAKSSVSPTLYGLMTEEINYSYDGGLYAELVRNALGGWDRANLERPSSQSQAAL